VAWIEDFTACLASATGSDLAIEKAFAIKAAHLPDAVFKFRGVTDYALTNLETDTAWLTTPKSYNDPYDCVASLSISDLLIADPALLRDALRFSGADAILGPDQTETALAAANPLREVARRLLEAEASIAKDEISPMLDALDAAQAALMGDRLQTSLDQIRDGIMMCSFCADQSPILMWSHYAAEHTGFCMEYRVPDMPDIVQRMLFPVIYREAMFDSTPYHQQAITKPHDFNNIYPLLQSLHKAPEWAYESEWRLVFTGGVIPEPINYPLTKPVAVYLGARISPENEQKILGICRRRDILVFRMALARDRFRLDATPVE